MILAGGLGTRLRERHPDLPKFLAPVAGRPFADWMLHWLIDQGIEHIHFSTGYRARQIQDYITSHKVFKDLPITFFTETTPLGTGGAVRANLPCIQGERFFVLNGDSLLPGLSLNQLRESMSPGSKGVLAVTHIRKTGAFGSIDLDEAGLILSFQEKRERSEGLVNGGVYFLARESLENWPEEEQFSLEHDVFPVLAGKKALQAMIVPPPLLDMGTPEGIDVFSEYARRHLDHAGN